MNGVRRCGIYTHGILLGHKKNKITPFAATWMELEIHTKLSKSEKERQIPHDITYIWNLNIRQMNLSTEQKLVDLKNRLVVAKGEREAVGWTGSLGLVDANSSTWSG